jgi:murein DD-endopeptidase MepM/ murein hydrolase activator NlpD
LLVVVFFSFFFYSLNPPPVASLRPDLNEWRIGAPVADAAAPRAKKRTFIKITGLVKKGETLNDIFRKNDLKTDNIPDIIKASKKSFSFTDIRPGMTYRIQVDKRSGDTTLFEYAIDDLNYLSIKKGEKGYKAKTVTLSHQKKKVVITGEIKSTLIDAVGRGREHIALAYDLADIFAADIDFTTDLRKKDTLKIVVEEISIDGVFKGYGDILYARFINNGRTYEAFRYKYNGREDYYDASGNSLKKALLRAPLRYRYVSSGFTYRRMHPILKIFRPHLGVDYVAPRGTPVSTAGDGVVIFAGFKPQDGNTVAIRHGNGYSTFYGHLSGFRKGLRTGGKVAQGDVIGYVGMTGLATGPHLDYRVKLNNRPVNPLSAKLPTAESIPAKMRKNFKAYVADMRSESSRNLVAAK